MHRTILKFRKIWNGDKLGSAPKKFLKYKNGFNINSGLTLIYHMANTVKRPRRRRVEMRREERISASTPVNLANAKGVMRDISASGIFFETETRHVPGNDIELAVELTTPAGKLQLKCHGVIVRIEQCGAREGVAVKISDSLLSYAEI